MIIFLAARGSWFERNVVDLIQKQFFEMLPADFTKQDAVKQAEVLGIGLNTLNKWLNKFVQSNDILHVAHGVYQKRIA